MCIYIYIERERDRYTYIYIYIYIYMTFGKCCHWAKGTSRRMSRARRPVL